MQVTSINALLFPRSACRQELSIKDVRSQGVVQCGHFWDKRSFSDACGRPHLLVQKYKFFEIYGMSGIVCTDKGGEIESVRTFCGQRGGINFSQFYANVLNGRSLMCYNNGTI